MFPKFGRCSYCGAEGAVKDNIGQQVLYVCGESECNNEHCRDESDSSSAAAFRASSSHARW